MFDHLVNDYETAFLMGVIGWLLANYLTDQGEVLSWWRLWVLDRLPERVAKPLGRCAMCTAGFWTLVIKVIYVAPLVQFCVSIILFYVAYVAASVAVAMLVAIALTKLFPNE